MFINQKPDIERIFLDRDGDGITDALDLQIHLAPCCSNTKVLTSLMDLSACLGFETMGMDLPFVSADHKKDSFFHHHLYVGLYDELQKLDSKGNRYDYFLEGRDENDLAESIRRFATQIISGKAKLSQGWRLKKKKGIRKFDLLNPFSIHGFYSGSTEISLPVHAPYKFLLFSDLDLETAVEATHFASRMGLETLSLDLPMTFSREDKPKEVRHLISIGKQEDLNKIDLNAYKPGLSWMREVVLNEIKGLKIHRIEIAFKAFQVKGMEESLRWLQEVYPIDEILSGKLSFSKDNIEFKKMNRLKEVYRFRAWKRGKMVYEKSFSPKWISQPYLTPFQRAGRVHPTTGWVEMKVNGKEMINQRVKTGIERIWEIYQGEILSLIEKEAKEVFTEKRRFHSGPVFEELCLDVYFNYPMEPLRIDEERISPLEALHEDFYFVTLDYFSKLLKKKG